MSSVDLSEFMAPEKQRSCAIGGACVHLAGDDFEKLQAALERDDIKASAIVAWLDKRGIKVNLSGVTHHRRGTCVCSR